MKTLWITVLILGCTAMSYAQIVIRGQVKDQQTQAPVAYAHVAILNTLRGTITADDGAFALKCRTWDTLRITAVGYVPLEVVVSKLSPNVVHIFSLHPDIQTLPAIVISDSAIMFQPKLPPIKIAGLKEPIKKPFREILFMREKNNEDYLLNSLTPGVKIEGALSYFTRERRENRKLRKAKKEARETAVYDQLVNSPAFQEETIKRFDLTYSA